jgi:hypothetical protein
MSVDLRLLGDWLEGRSLARELPGPISEFGGFRVDTGSQKEVCRWVFAKAEPGLKELASAISASRHLLKLCGTPAKLAALLPARWGVEQTGCFMTTECDAAPLKNLPPGYRTGVVSNGAVSRVEIRDGNDELAASGYAAETRTAFVYDRVETDLAHRRRGLGRAVMAALGQCRRSKSTRQLLVATLEGEKLYAALDWRTLSPYSTAEFLAD